MDLSSAHEGGLERAKEHGYRPETLGTRRCRNCAHGGPESRDGYVQCHMFGFKTRGTGVCREWEEEASR